MWPFSKRSKRRPEAVPDLPDEVEPDEVDEEDEFEQLRREVRALRFDLDDLTERFLRREGRDNKRRSRDTGPADGPEAAPTRRNGLPSLAQLRAAGRDPFTRS